MSDAEEVQALAERLTVEFPESRLIEYWGVVQGAALMLHRLLAERDKERSNAVAAFSDMVIAQRQRDEAERRVAGAIASIAALEAQLARARLPVPTKLQRPPLYADESAAEQFSYGRYVDGWNDCVDRMLAAAPS